MITMRKWIIIFFLFIVLPCNVLFADWTIMLYLDADNDLKQYTDEIFSDIAKVGSLAGQVNIVALYDRTYDANNPGDWTDTRRGIIQTNDIVN